MKSLGRKTLRRLIGWECRPDHPRADQYIRGRHCGVMLVRRTLANQGRTPHSAQKLEIVRGHFSAFAVGDELEAHLLTFLQISNASSLDSADMDKGVIAAIVRRDKAEALLGVKPFHGSRSHKETLS